MAMDRETQLLQAAADAGIDSREELANFMAQVCHESDGLTRLEEGFRYTKGTWQIPVKSAMREGAEALESARLGALQGKPEKLAELMYGSRMGNDEPGDGYKYRGRGYIQLTGKNNYEQAGEALDLELVKHPELAADPENAARIATWYWQQNVPEAAREDVKKATQAINGGLNGLADRETRYEKWHETLTPELMEMLSAGKVGLSVAPAAPSSHGLASDGLVKQGERGTEVRNLQAALNQLGYPDAQGRALSTDGDFGDRTLQALLAFQQANGLKADGIAGPRTVEALQHAEQAPLLSNPNHPQHALYQQSYEQLRQLDPKMLGFTSDRDYQNAAASLAFEARVSGLTQVNHVVPSSNGAGLIALQGRLDDPSQSRLYVDKVQAASQPLQQSTRQIEQDVRQQVQQAGEAPRQPESRQQQPEEQAHEPRRMAMI